MPNESFYIGYRFWFENGKELLFDIELDADTLLLKNKSEEGKDWAKLESFKCPNCPLSLSENKYCPLALSLKNILGKFSDIQSTEVADVFVKTNERTYHQKVAVQRGLSSLLGVVMPTSGCPVLAKLKPMVKFHLPFATSDETEFRVYSSYLFAQYLKNRKGSRPDWEMKNLQQIYDDISTVNYHVTNKIRELSKKDANLNAVVILETFSSFVSMSLQDKDFEHLDKYFDGL
jgi:hypothetical protein